MGRNTVELHLTVTRKSHEVLPRLMSFRLVSNWHILLLFQVNSFEDAGYYLSDTAPTSERHGVASIFIEWITRFPEPDLPH